MNIVEHVTFLYVGASFGYMPKRGIAGSSGSSSINANAKLLYDYDKSDTKIEGKWHERARNIPKSIQLMIESHEQDRQLLEIDYDILRESGIIE